MGTAPKPEQPLAMPSPKRVVGRSVRTLKRLGMSEHEALKTVYVCAVSVFARLIFAGQENSDWVMQILETARERLESLDPSNSEHTGEDHADGTGSRAGESAYKHDRPA